MKTLDEQYRENIIHFQYTSQITMVKFYTELQRQMEELKLDYKELENDYSDFRASEGY